MIKTPLCAFLAMTLLIGCTEASQEEERANLNARKQAIVSMAKSGSCLPDSVCRYAALGSKPCGGPWGYVVYSASIDEAQFLQLIAKYNLDEAFYNQRWGIASDCMIVPPPDSVKCLSDTCVGYWGGLPR